MTYNVFGVTLNPTLLPLDFCEPYACHSIYSVKALQENPIVWFFVL